MHQLTSNAQPTMGSPTVYRYGDDVPTLGDAVGNVSGHVGPTLDVFKVACVPRSSTDEVGCSTTVLHDDVCATKISLPRCVRCLRRNW